MWKIDQVRLVLLLNNSSNVLSTNNVINVYWSWEGSRKYINLNVLFVMSLCSKIILKTYPRNKIWQFYLSKKSSLWNWSSSSSYVMRFRSEVELVTFSVFYLIEVFIKRCTFCWKPHLNHTSGPKVIAIERFSKQQKTKEMHSFFWLYLTINAPDFRLIPLDRNTYFS